MYIGTASAQADPGSSAPPDKAHPPSLIPRVTDHSGHAASATPGNSDDEESDYAQLDYAELYNEEDDVALAAPVAGQHGASKHQQLVAQACMVWQRMAQGRGHCMSVLGFSS